MKMGIVDNIKKRMAGAAAQDQSEYDDAYADDGYYSDTFGSYDETEDTDAGMSAQPSMAGAGISLSGSSGSALEMKVVKPESFDSVAQIADHLISRRTVVLNLENTNKETSRRLIDFLSGVAYSIDGSLKKIASNAYVITPSNVNVGDAKLTSRKAPEPEPAPAPVVDDFGEY
ncbi:MAG: cell division protein SepF [Ruminococcaceae bacterium]|nr:cell division protein SepF [Oscillospiraceae bacterium]